MEVHKVRQPFLVTYSASLHTFGGVVLVASLLVQQGFADQQLLKTHCAKCHAGPKPKGDFDLRSLGAVPGRGNVALWETSLDYVKAGEMPPAKQSRLSKAQRRQIVDFLEDRIRAFNSQAGHSKRTRPRRLNNREFENSIRDALMIEDVGTHQPTANLIGDSRHDGFDTHAETLGFSNFHLEQYIEAIRRIVDATVLTGDRPAPKYYDIKPTEIFAEHTSQNITRPERQGKREGFDFLDPLQRAYFDSFKTAPETGWYRITIRCTGKDRGVYDSEKTGIYDSDPIRLSVQLGDRERVFDLPDEQVRKIELQEWIAAGSRLRLQHPTDGLRLRGNGNFKFQNAITGEHLKQYQPDLYARGVAAIEPKKFKRGLPPQSWHHWVDYWQGPRPRIFSAVVEGPFYESWPPVRQTALLGTDPRAENTESILTPIAERAWRREVREGELDRIVALVQAQATATDDVAALKEGIVAILTSPNFLLINQSDRSAEERFVTKFSYLLTSTLPDRDLRTRAAAGTLKTFEEVRDEVERRFNSSDGNPFLKAFPIGWLKLNDINFMAPDPDHFRHYHRKRVSEDMVDEVLQLFSHAVDHNIPLPELLTADYSFVNADLAQIYGLSDGPQDSTFRRYTFTDGRRGGLIGTGAFLTVTADSLATSPIHRAIYVMENFLDIHPAPPPADVVIEEPDVRSARTIKEVLEAHRSDKTCASCHESIDPFGYAFENFDPTGAWRDTYAVLTPESAGDGSRRARPQTVPIDASASFRNGTKYRDIVEFRRLMQSDANRDRFVRCFVTKLLTYANGEEPHDYTEIETILARSAENDYRIVDTIAAVIHSPLFREE